MKRAVGRLGATLSMAYRLAVGIDEAQAGGGLDAADGRHGHAGAFARRAHGLVLLRRCGEEQLVVVAAGQHAAVLQRPRPCGDDGAARQRVDLDCGAHARARQHVAEVADEAVRQVDGTRGQAAQRQAQSHARLGLLHRAAHGVEVAAGELDRAAEHLERQPRIAQPAAHPEPITRARAAAQQRLPGRHLADHGEAQVQRPGGGVAAHELDAVDIGQRKQAASQGGREGVVAARQRQRQGEGQWLGAAGGEVAQVDGQRLVTQALGRHRAEEVPALDQHVARHRQLLPRRGRQQRAVVAHAQAHGSARAPARPREVPRDELELTRHHA
jgi:hypothetical protein